MNARLLTRPHPLLRLAVHLRRWRKPLLATTTLALVGLGVGWQVERLSHITETDARVMSDLVTVSSRSDGWVAKRLVTDGDSVATGQALVEIDRRETELQVRELQAKLDALGVERNRTALQLQIAETTAPNAVTEANARQTASEASLRAAASELERNQKDYQRANTLVGSDFLSRQTWDLRHSQLRQAEESQRAAQAKLTEARTEVSGAKAKLAEIDLLRQTIAELDHNAQEIQAQIDQRRIETTDRTIQSPITGVVDRKFVEAGEYVIPGQRLLLLHDPKAVWVEANVKETKIARLRPGQSVSIDVDAYPNRHFVGTIERVGNATTSEFALLPSPNPSGNFTKITQRVPVRIAVIQPNDNPLRPGMMVEVDIDTAHH